jgi:hypothetical protein
MWNNDLDLVHQLGMLWSNQLDVIDSRNKKFSIPLREIKVYMNGFIGCGRNAK